MNKKLKYSLFAVTQILTFLPLIAFVNNYLFNFLGVKSKWYVINVAPHVAEQVNLNGMYSDKNSYISNIICNCHFSSFSTYIYSFLWKKRFVSRITIMVKTYN